MDSKEEYISFYQKTEYLKALISLTMQPEIAVNTHAIRKANASIVKLIDLLDSQLND